MFARRIRGQLQQAAAERDYREMRKLAEDVKRGAETSGNVEDAVADTRFTPDLFVIAAEAAIEVASQNSFCTRLGCLGVLVGACWASRAMVCRVL
jgi:hypothetical protein